MKTFSYIDTLDSENRITACFNHNEESNRLTVGLAFRREGDTQYKYRARLISEGRSETKPHFFATNVTDARLIELKKAFREKMRKINSEELLRRNLNHCLSIRLDEYLK